MDPLANENSDTKDSGGRNNKLSQRCNWRVLKGIVPRNLSVNARDGRLRFGHRKRRSVATAGSWPRRNNARVSKGNGRAARQLGTRTTNLASSFCRPLALCHFPLQTVPSLPLPDIFFLIYRLSGSLRLPPRPPLFLADKAQQRHTIKVVNGRFFSCDFTHTNRRLSFFPLTSHVIVKWGF